MNEKFAIIKTGSGQSIVKSNDVIAIDLQKCNKDDKISFDPLMILTESGENQYNSGKVSATVVSPLEKGEKVIAYKKRRRTSNSRDMKGHRQKYTVVRIDSIES